MDGRLLAQALGDVSDDQVWRVLRKHKIQLQRRRSWCISTDPEFGPKAADVVGLYLSLRKMPWCFAWMKNRTSRYWRERGMVATAERKSAKRIQPLLQTARDQHPVAALEVATGQSRSAITRDADGESSSIL